MLTPQEVLDSEAVAVVRSQSRRNKPNFYSSQLISYLYQKLEKLGVTDFVSEIKRVEHYPDFEKLAHVIQHGLQGFIVKTTEGESMETNHLRPRSDAILHMSRIK